jgi:hypothetical protein
MQVEVVISRRVKVVSIFPGPSFTGVVRGALATKLRDCDLERQT